MCEINLKATIKDIIHKSLGKYEDNKRPSHKLAVKIYHNYGMNIGTQGHRNTGTQEHKNTGIQEYRNTGIQEHRNTGTQEHRNIQSYIKNFIA